jgi:phage/plasmid-like protein (TIGR03299 family)
VACIFLLEFFIMAHMVEKMFYVGETPWHGLGVALNESPTIREAIVAAGLDWTVALRDLFTADGVRVGHRATVRESDGSILGVVGPRYQPLQNADALDWFQPFVDSGEARLHTAGSLDEGRKVWVLAELNRDPSVIVPGDDVRKFILLSNSHDGTTAVRPGFTPIRVVCANTLAAAHCSTASKFLRVRHTRKIASNLEKVRDIMNAANADFEATADQYRYLASKDFNQADVRRYVKILLDVENVSDADMPTRTKNIIEEVLATIEGPRQSLPGVKGTWWSAYNGFNEYLNYTRGRNSDNRMNSLWFGTGSTDNRKALELALSMSV